MNINKPLNLPKRRWIFMSNLKNYPMLQKNVNMIRATIRDNFIYFFNIEAKNPVLTSLSTSKGKY